ncbi:MAG TPA: SIMPL domain-containing protein, partial [Thermoanaerobaculia bacterium]
MRRIVFGPLLFVLFAAVVEGQGRVAGALEDGSRTIAVNGEAVIYVVPDEAIVRLGVETFAPSLAEATSSNSATGSRIVKALRALGLSEKNTQADHAEVEIVYPKDGVAAGIAGYRVRRAYAVTVTDVSRLDGVIEAALKNGANHLEGYELRTTELRKYRDEARKQAVNAAREKAEALAAELGCKLGAPRSIGESYYGWFGT